MKTSLENLNAVKASSMTGILKFSRCVKSTKRGRKFCRM